MRRIGTTTFGTVGGVAGLAVALVMTAGCGGERGSPVVPPAAAAGGQGSGQQRSESGGSPDVRAIAAAMPRLAAENGVVTLPLTSNGEVAWRAIREGVSVEERGGAVEVKYTRTRMKAAGAAMVVREGTLTGLTRLELRMRDTRTQRLAVSMKDSAGAVWSFPSVQLPGGETVERVLNVSDVEPDAYQNHAPVKGPFDPSKVVMVMVLDIGGYMSIDEPVCAWTIESAKGVCR